MKHKCHKCGYVFNTHTTLKFEMNPEEGDISICLNCANVTTIKEGKFKSIDITKLDSETQKEINKIKKARTEALGI